MNPRTGAREKIGEFEQDGAHTFTPPTGNEDPDWVLVLQSARPDTTAPRIAAVSAGGDPSQVRVRFTEPVAPTGAERDESYSVQPDVMVQGAELSGGGTVVTLTTTPMTEREYTLSVSGVADLWEPPNVVAPGTTAAFTWTAEPPRVADGLVSLYTFDALEDGLIADGSDVAEPLPLAIEDGSGADALDGELVVGQSSLIASQRPATELSRAIMQSGEVTIEAWVQPANLEQGGPARIVTLSKDPGERNFTLGQEGDRYVVRFRTTETDANGMPMLESPEGALTTDLAHVVYTRAADGTARLYLNGGQVATREVPGELSAWSDQYRLGLANELTRDRTWLGAIRLVAIYDRALAPDEVAENFGAGE
ncbi:MAG: LamG-like jellyroll fold domain-containing protein [Armatimonadota bacterium]